MVGIEERDYEQPKSTSSLDSSLGNQKVVEINNSELLKEVFSVDEKMFQIAKNLLAKHVPDITQELLNWLKTNGKEEIAKFI
jgi:predicted ATPase